MDSCNGSAPDLPFHPDPYYKHWCEFYNRPGPTLLCHIWWGLTIKGIILSLKISPEILSPKKKTQITMNRTHKQYYSPAEHTTYEHQALIFSSLFVSPSRTYKEG